MSSDWQEPVQEEMRDKRESWESRRRMALAVTVGLAGSFVLIGIGIYFLVTGGHNGDIITAMGSAGLLFWVIEIPILLRSGKLVIGRQ